MTEIDTASFDTEVIEASKSTPILVDFWAEWCGPCRVLGPVLEKLADAADGRWKLVKVNTDENPELSARYNIRGIPAVKLFMGGKVVDEFTGALPEHAVRRWLEKAIPSESARKLDAARRAAAEGKVDEAKAQLESVLENEPSHEEARIILAAIIVFEEPKRAGELVTGSMPAQPGLLQMAEAIKSVSRLIELSEVPDALPEAPVRSQYVNAIRALARRDFDHALSGFIDVVMKDRSYDDDGARKACIALFILLGDGHPSVRKYRRQFDMALY